MADSLKEKTNGLKSNLKRKTMKIWQQGFKLEILKTKYDNTYVAENFVPRMLKAIYYYARIRTKQSKLKCNCIIYLIFHDTKTKY